MKKLKKGLLIPFYGINNLGKTTQVNETIKDLRARGYTVRSQKYAVYDLEPSGVLINEYLRHGNPHKLSAETFQTLQVLNRTQFEPQLKKWLSNGEIVIAEDYLGTGIAWGMGAGISKEYLVQLNSHLLKEDIAFYFYGNRFTGAIEKGHAHEENNKLTNKVAKAHLELAKQYKWVPVNANREIAVITNEIVNMIERHIDAFCE